MLKTQILHRQSGYLPAGLYTFQVYKSHCLCCLLLTILIYFHLPAQAASCHGKFLNPFTDVCWKCLFPISIGPASISGSGIKDTPNSGSLICLCKGKLPGISIGFWEPVRVVEVTRTPYCMVNLGGIKLAENSSKQGTVGHKSGRASDKRSYYHAHWYVYPVMYILELLTDFACMEKASFDIGYMTEFDPFWNDDAKAAILNPEALLFGSPLTQVACGADCVSATTSLPLDELFWCGGCQGSLYPFTGTVPAHYSGVQASQLVVQKMIAKLHRQLLMDRTSGSSDREICQKSIAPQIKKTQYRIQMTYPNPDNSCAALGASTVRQEMGKERPYTGEDFSYLIWRKRNCCLGVGLM